MISYTRVQIREYKNITVQGRGGGVPSPPFKSCFTIYSEDLFVTQGKLVDVLL